MFLNNYKWLKSHIHVVVQLKFLPISKCNWAEVKHRKKFTKKQVSDKVIPCYVRKLHTYQCDHDTNSHIVCNNMAIGEQSCLRVLLLYFSYFAHFSLQNIIMSTILLALCSDCHISIDISLSICWIGLNGNGNMLENKLSCNWKWT